MDYLQCDIASDIQNSDFSVLQKISSQWCSLRTELTAKIEGFAVYNHEYSEKKILANNTIAALQHDIERLNSEIETAQLDQKILVKKICNAVKSQEELVKEVDLLKAHKDNLSIELAELKQEVDKRREKKVLTWDAIKRACRIYNQHLDFHLHLEEINEGESVKVSFFQHNDDVKDQYYAYMIRHDNEWTVIDIHPILKKEYTHELRGGLLDTTSNRFKISNVPAFLCCLRSIFKKYYIN